MTAATENTLHVIKVVASVPMVPISVTPTVGHTVQFSPLASFSVGGASLILDFTLLQDTD